MRRGRNAGRRPGRRYVAALLLASIAACGGDDASPAAAANQAVRERLLALHPANLAHRGSGPTRPSAPLPENSLAAFRDAMDKGADGVELDVVLTADGRLLVMHDDTLDRTTTCSGCVSARTLAEAQQCALVDGRGAPTAERPPSLAQAYAALPDDALVNVELKVAGRCATPSSGAEALARAAAAEVRRLGAARRTLFSSFDAAAVTAIKRRDPALYAALLSGSIDDAGIAAAAGAGFDAIHPVWSGISAEQIAGAQSRGLQVNLWTVNGVTFLTQSLAKGPDAIITDQPAVLAELLGR